MLFYVFNVFSCFHVLCRPTACAVVFYERRCISYRFIVGHCIDLVSYIAASLFNKLTYVLPANGAINLI